MKKILLLGSGELGKEFTIAAQRLGQHIIACDNYPGAPAMQVADEFEVFSMLDGDALDAVVAKHKPDVIISEIEAIRTERLYDYEKQGVRVAPSARAVNFTMNRKAIRDLAAKDLGLKTAKYFYATTLEELQKAADSIGYPCIVKPLMSSSGKGQTLVKGREDVAGAFDYGMAGSRGDVKELIVEEFIQFDYEITLLTVTRQRQHSLLPSHRTCAKRRRLSRKFSASCYVVCTFGRSTTHGQSYHRSPYRCRTLGRGVLHQRKEWSLLQRTLPSSPRHRNGDPGRYAKLQ